MPDGAKSIEEAIAAGKVTLLEEYLEFVEELDKQYSDYWLEPGANPKDVNRLAKKMGGKVMNDILTKKARDAFASGASGRFAKMVKYLGYGGALAVSFLAVFDDVSVACAIANPNPEQEARLQILLRRYHDAMAFEERNNYLTQAQASHVQEALDDYLNSIGASDDFRAKTKRQFELAKAELP